ncbi:DUF4332 domain-containing protein [Rosistilla oblonga]|uniref:DUF4332 domain-containing protein n=1 Tax=Rosistilla oblonga TaxID=2527990 RepID=UPI003A985D49
MLLERLDIDVYGPFGKKNIGPFSNGINAIWGPEGSGKTAIVDFIRGVMLGNQYDRHGATVGRVTWADHRGLYHCQRESDGTHDGRLLIDFSPRDAAYADERYRHYGYHSRRPDAIPPALVDMVVAPDTNETSIARVFEAAASVGFELACAVNRPSEEIERIKLRLVDIDAQIGRDYRGTENRDELEMRRRRLTTELETLERGSVVSEKSLDRPDRSHAEQRLRAAQLEATRLRHFQDELRESITDIQDEMDRLSHVPQHEPQRWTIAEDYRLQLEELDAQLVRWRRTMQEVRSLRERLQDSSDKPYYSDAATRPAYRSGADAASDPYEYLSSLEGRIDHAQRQLDALAGCYTDGYYRYGNDASTQARNLHAMRDELHTIREGLGRRDAHQPHARFDDELAQLRRCEQELMSAIERLIADRSDLMRLASREHGIPMDQLSSAYGDWNPYTDTPHLRDWLVSEHCPPSVGSSDAASARRQRLQDELTGLRSELQRADDQLATVVRDIDNLQRDMLSQPIERRPFVDSDRMAHLRNELADVRRRLEWLDSLDGLRRERARLDDELRRMEAAGHATQSPLIACANHWLTRLTAGRLRTIELVGPDQVRVDGRRESDISSDDRRTAALAVRMAVCCLMNENRTGMPLIIDDPVVHHHDHRSVARTLVEFAAGGNQVLVLTRSQALVDDLSEQGAWTDALPARNNLNNGAAGSDLYDVNRFLDMAWRESNGLYDNPSHTPGRSWSPANNYPRRRTMRGLYEPNHRKESRTGTTIDGETLIGRHFLTPESHIDLAPSVDSVAAARLRGIGVESVGDLLTSNAANIASRIGLAGVSDRTIRRWQIESDLVCRVPGLRPFDARILVGCGVTTPKELAQLHPTELLVKVERFLATDLGRETLRSGTSYELSRITTWIASASRAVLRGHRDGERQSTRTTRTSTRSRSGERSDESRGGRTTRVTRRRRTSSRDGQSGESTSRPLSSDHSSFPNPYDHESVRQRTGSVNSYRETYDYDGDGIADLEVEYEYDHEGNRVVRSTKRSSSRNGSGSSNSSSRSSNRSSSRSSNGSSDREGSSNGRSQRSTRTRVTRTSRGERSERSTVPIDGDSKSRTLRYYLSNESDVVDAPSIGPSMAKRLEKAGVYTVADLLDADPAFVADKLNHRRITAETVRQWQLQSKLMCTSPMLRGHDAQLLVAAEITSAKQLSQCNPKWLLDEVTPIAHSSEGKRILRGAPAPDLAEVTDWITWAGQRDQVVAA